MSTRNATIDQSTPVPDKDSTTIIDDQITNIMRMIAAQETMPASLSQIVSKPVPVDHTPKSEVQTPKAAPTTAAQATAIPTLPPLATPAARSKKSLKRFIRPLIGIGFVLFSAWATMPLVIDVRSTQAVVNAPITTLRSPIGGTIAQLHQGASGTNADTDAVLFNVNNPLVDENRLDALNDEKAFLESQIKSARQQLASMTDLRDGMETTVEKYKKAKMRLLQLERDGSAAALESVKILEKQRLAEQETLTQLKNKLSISKQDVAAAEFAVETVHQDVIHAQKKVEDLDEQLSSLENGVHVGPGDGSNDLPYSTQRLHDLNLRLVETRESIQQNESKLEQLDRHINAEKERLAKQSTYTAKTPADWVVWRRHVVEGSAIQSNTPLMDMIDPKEIFIDAVMSEKNLARVKPGDVARVRVAGYDKEYQAVVKQVVGHTLPWPDTLLAAESLATSKQEVHVLLSFMEPFPRDGEVISIPIGRPAEVIFHSVSDYVKQIAPKF